MKVILLKDVKKQGKKGQIIDVKDGYGNFLIKNKEAVLATTGSVDRLERETETTKLEENLLIKDMEVLKNKLEKLTITFKVKSGNDGRVFGSISTKQISSELSNKGYEIDKKKINLKEPLSTLGFHEVRIVLHKKVEANIKVKLEESK